MVGKRKQYLWLPYVSSIKTGNKEVKISYKGGELEIDWKNIHSIMFYGENTDLPQDFLEKCAFYKIPVIIHRRNIPRAVIICPTLPPDQDNILTNQVIFRQNEKKKAYIGKKLLQAKFKSMSWLIPLKRDLLYRIIKIEDMLNVESWHAKNYWEVYFEKLGINGKRRGEKNNENNNFVKKCLDATSKFLSGVILRWVLYHNLSPYHGFLHKPTDYPALVYDLMEPYRGFFDKVVFDSIKTLKKEGVNEENKYLGYTIENVKNFLEIPVYVEATRQIATFQELLHGVVLALRCYLLKETKRFIVPFPSKPNGGRPIKAGYSLYGHIAGKTDFWEKSKGLSEKFKGLIAIKNQINLANNWHSS